MKFGKKLHSHVQETLPTWKDKYLSYKHLKKRLSTARKLNPNPFYSPSPSSSSSSSSSVTFDGSAGEYAMDTVSADVAAAAPGYGRFGSDQFVEVLDLELEKLNAFFVDKEEEYVIRLQELKERCERIRNKCGKGMPLDSRANLNEEMMNIRKDIVDFHGEMVLLENYSSLNYIGLVKILKKHDKRTGIHLRMPYISNVLHQPFFTTELLSRLVHECEMNLQLLFSIDSNHNISTTSHDVDADDDELAAAHEQLALHAAHQLRPSKTLAQQYAANAMDVGMQCSDALKLDHDAYVEGDGDESKMKMGALVASPGHRSLSRGADVVTFPHDLVAQGDHDAANNIYRSTLAALRIMRDIRRRSSTYSVFSLPPLNDDYISV